VGEPPLHPDLGPLVALVGTWVGEGKGDYPTIESFSYREESRFAHAGKPFLSYLQRTWSLQDGAPLHSESGFWRPSAGGVEVVLAHPFGVVEIQEGTVDGGVIETRSRALVGTSTAEEIAEVARRIEVTGDLLRYTVDMATSGKPLQRHLEAELARVA